MSLRNPKFPPDLTNLHSEILYSSEFLYKLRQERSSCVKMMSEAKLMEKTRPWNLIIVVQETFSHGLGGKYVEDERRSIT